uniref:Uncharacterized protein n=1 Tax=Anguilla anguilla TaxID=7936 RepID=A0A0E9PGD2_ANGAN
MMKWVYAVLSTGEIIFYILYSFLIH